MRRVIRRYDALPNSCGIDLREIDAVGRYGGEEFGAVLVNTGGVAGQDLMYRLIADLRARVAQAEARMQMQTLQTISLAECTVSIGLVPFSTIFDTPQLWLQYADRALYRAKREGRDGMVVLDAEGETKTACEGEMGAAS